MGNTWGIRDKATGHMILRAAMGPKQARELLDEINDHRQAWPEWDGMELEVFDGYACEQARLPVGARVRYRDPDFHAKHGPATVLSHEGDWQPDP